MTRTKLKDRILPDYTRGEEIFNMITHIVGGALGVVAVTLCVIFAALKNNTWGVVGSAIYGGMMILLYTMSSVYHGLKPDTMAKKVMQVLDHCSIFLLIAGTYTPIALSSLRAYSPLLGWGVFGFVWAAAILGITLNAIDLKKYKTFSMICYLAMGWCIIFAAKATYLAIGLGGVIFLLSGGICYTIGAVLYIALRKKRYGHSIFHIFVVLGSLLHFFAILWYVI